MEGVGEWISADVSRCGPDPIEFLHQQICPEVSVLRAGTIPELAATPEFQGKLVWVEGVGCHLVRLVGFPEGVRACLPKYSPASTHRLGCPSLRTGCHRQGAR